MLGIIGGTSLLDYKGSLYTKFEQHTPYGTSEIIRGDNFLLLLRHQNRCAPHIIPYRSHIAALKLAGARRIIALGSTGSLQEHIPPGSRVIPDDYVCLTPVPTIMNHSIDHVNPAFDPHLRSLLIQLCPDAVPHGTYIQTRGPRLESRSEIQWMKNIADIVGMTIASELTVACEMRIPFAAICTVDNYANGICNAEISYESIISTVRENQEKALDLLGRIIDAVA
ncbi:MTAP family purine nucleoside phosphorylase [Methanospirillum sp.]|nr:MTAP family purine nucleoside phosphorylase [Methanospirillum sp.]HOL41645.1 MTAP family purine nucleoside phosphorylase [Methanospirillum sp.]